MSKPGHAHPETPWRSNKEHEYEQEVRAEQTPNSLPSEAGCLFIWSE